MALRLCRAAEADDWIYRGEGAANIVLAYAGSSPAFIGKVLRVHKVPRTDGVASQAVHGAPVLSAHERLLWKDVDGLAECTSEDVAGQLFTLHVMSPLLGPEHVDPGAHVLVSDEFLHSIEQNIYNQRPSWRVVSAKINTLCDSALLMSDHSFFPHGGPKESACIAVEIKPKCGFLPSSKFIRKENAVKTCVTRFKMHQTLKFHQGKIPRISEYDPLDIFSGSRERISQAILGLFNCPQNNFRVFFNGSLAFGASGDVMEKNEISGTETQNQYEVFENMLKKVILANNGQSLRGFLELVGEAIFSSEIMAHLVEVQKLDLLDIEGAIHAYYNIISQPCSVCNNLCNDDLLKRYSTLHSLALDKSLEIVKNYLIAATAKDCSLMICFKPSENVASDNASVFLKSTNQSFEYKIYFVDLDMKPLSKMRYYYELDQKVVEFYKGRQELGVINAGNPKECCAK